MNVLKLWADFSYEQTEIINGLEFWTDDNYKETQIMNSNYEKTKNVKN